MTALDPYDPELTTIAPIVVYPHERVTGWSGDVDGASLFPAVDAVEALTAPYDTDAHGHGVLIPAGPEATAAGYPWEPLAPRIKLEALPSLIATGQEPRIGWAFVDLDNPAHARHADPAAAADRVRALVEEAPPGSPLASAGYYMTRAGARLVWRLGTPIPVTRYAAWCERLFGAIARTSGIPVARPGEGGIDATCSQWFRLYRLPRATRDGVAQRPVIDLHRTLRDPLSLSVGPLHTLRRDPLPASAPQGTPPPPRPSDALPGADGAPLPQRGALPPYPGGPEAVPEDVWSALASAHGGRGVACYAAAYNGAVLAKKGGRNEAMIKAVGEVLASLPPTNDPGALARTTYAVLARSVDAWHGDDGAPTLALLWDRCQWFGRKKAAEAALAAVVQLTPAVVYGLAGANRFYVWNERIGTYEGPFNTIGLVPAIEKYAPTLGIVTRGPSGRPRDPVELVADYGAPVRRVVVRLGAEASTYDGATGTLIEAAAPLVPVTAEHDPAVDRWLRLLGGDDPERWLDWLATVTRTDAPTAAVYLRSEPSTGKGMLAIALARLWGASAPCAYVDAIGDFNSGLLTCPLVHLDEGIPAARGLSINSSAAFRSLVSESSRRLARKFQDVAVLEGCPRVLVTANNDDALALRDRMSADDVAAVAERILYLRAAPETAAYLEGIGGREVTVEWVGAPGTVGAIGRHVAWLAEHRPVRFGPRFLVHGAITDYHRDLATKHGIVAEVLAAVAHVAARVAGGGKPPHGIAFPAPGAGPEAGVLVNVQTLRKVWATTGAPVPSEHTVANALSTISIGKRTIRDEGTIDPRGNRGTPGRYGKQLRVWVLSPSHVLRVAEELQIGDPEAMRAILLGGT